MAKSSKLINDPDDLISGMLSVRPNHLLLKGRSGRGLSTESQCAKAMFIKSITEKESIHAINIAPQRRCLGN